ncbi:MAG: outer membrane lipoprotein-sorting protein [Pseudorhodobacter sp.]|jgi:outer membrane lipoprotein-sorting protein
MNRRHFFRTIAIPFGAMALLTALAMPAAAQKIPLSELSRYMNALTTAEAEFTQINADGSIGTGKLFIQRPGRVRFEYAPPDRSLVVAGGGQVAVFDAKSNQPPEQYPLSRTPLSIILARNVDLARAKMVVGHTEDGNTTRVRAQDPEHPEYGSIELVFTAGPTELRQWVIRDDGGSETTVILGEMTRGIDIAASLFNISLEADRRNR